MIATGFCGLKQCERDGRAVVAMKSEHTVQLYGKVAVAIQHQDRRTFVQLIRCQQYSASCAERRFFNRIGYRSVAISSAELALYEFMLVADGKNKARDALRQAIIK